MKSSKLSPQMKIFRLSILQQIFEHFQQMTQWNVEHPGSTAKYANMAEGLIEALEVEDCGSMGGFDNSNPLTEENDYELYNRFLTVLRKYHADKDIEDDCHFNVANMADYFNKIVNLREEYNK
jgi:hypothetical protein